MKGRGIAVLAWVAVVVAAAFLTGCGSDSSSNASATEEAAAPLTKAQFVKQAEKICQQGVEQKDENAFALLKERAARGEEGPPTPDETGKMVEEIVVPAYRKTIDELSRLGAPKQDSAKVKKLMDELEAAFRSLQAEPVKANEDNPFKQVDKAIEAYGIENCAL